MIRILVADDHTVVREGVKQILSNLEDIVVEDEAGMDRRHWRRRSGATSRSCSTSPCPAGVASRPSKTS